MRGPCRKEKDLDEKENEQKEDQKDEKIPSTVLSILVNHPIDVSPELINRIGKLQSKIVELESEKEELKNKSTGNNAQAKNGEAGEGDALELHERERKLEMWAETLKRQQKNLDDESLSLANDLKLLKDREERLLRITDNALHDDSLKKSQRVDGNTLINSSLDNSWSNALGLEE